MANKVNEYPKWVEKYRKKGVTIRKTKYGYGLYKCTSRYVKGKKYPETVQEFLGMVYEDKGFVAKSRRVSSDEEYLEYGLSSFIMNNFKRDLLKASYDHNEKLVKLSVIMYIFGSIDERILSRSFLTYDDEELIAYSHHVSLKRIHTITVKIEKLLTEKIPDEQDRQIMIGLLRLCVIAKSSSMLPCIDEELESLKERYGLQLW